MRIPLLISFLLIISIQLISAQNVLIPDEVFKLRLIIAGYDTNGDSLISFMEAEAVDSLDFSVEDMPVPSFGKIENLTGIEALLNLVYFDCRNNIISGTADFSDNLNLQYLNCSQNSIDSMILTNLDQLSELYVQFNDLKILDLNSNVNLKILRMGLNYLTEIDLTDNINLENLIFLGNSFSTLDLSNNINLQELAVSGAQHHLNELDVTNCVELRILTVSYIDIVELDISQNQKLEKLTVNFLDSLQRICVWEIPFPDSIEVVSYMNPVPFAMCATTINSLTDYTSPMGAHFNGDILEITCEENGIVEVYCISGLLLESRQLLKNRIERINMSQYSDGIYLTRFNWKNQTTTEKRLKY